MRKIVAFSLVLLITVLGSACGAAPTPAKTAVPVAPPALAIFGKVNTPLQPTLDEIKALGVEKLTLEHPKNGPTEYEGVRLNKLLDAVGPTADATSLLLSASDGFTSTVALADVRACADCLVAINGTTLNLAMPGLASKAWVKGVVAIEVK